MQAVYEKSLIIGSVHFFYFSIRNVQLRMHRTSTQESGGLSLQALRKMGIDISSELEAEIEADLTASGDNRTWRAVLWSYYGDSQNE